MANERNEKIEEAASPSKPRVSPESRKSISIPAQKVARVSPKSEIRTFKGKLPKEYRQALQKIQKFKVVEASPEDSKIFLEAYESLRDKMESVREKVEQAKQRCAVPEAKNPAMNDIGQIVAAAVKGKTDTASILEKPALKDVNDIVAAAKEVFRPREGVAVARNSCTSSAICHSDLTRRDRGGKAEDS
jgi:hypothetical protein